ncbi:unnamed protein product [Cylindrotheca closterium]|uniref:J domain-containing protein n=1 Tax=Cylindrotheca closterium TaxID=2856 RepID=A0AAD2CH56_9STRA|nr:unnamed protein product [Cylindrotheca closterium]
MLDNPYLVLGLSHDASESDVKKAYHKAALKYHPDRQINQEKNGDGAIEKFTEIKEAYEILSDPVKRYDWRQQHENGSARATRTTAKTPFSSSRVPPPPNAYDYTSPVSNSSKRAEFMAKKHHTQHESNRTPSVSPGRSARRKKRQNHSPAPRRSPMRSPKASPRSVRHPASSSPSSWVKPRVRSSSANVRTKHLSHSPVSVGAACSQRRNVRRLSMPHRPLSASPHRKKPDMVLQDVPEGVFLPTMATANGRGFRKSVKRNSLQPALYDDRHDSPRQVLRQSVRRNSLQPTLYNSRHSPRNIPKPPLRRNSLDHGVHGRKKHMELNESPPIRKNSLEDASSRKVKKTEKKTKKRKPKSPKSQPPPPPRKSMFGTKSLSIRKIFTQ